MRIGINLLQFKEITGLAIYTQNILENFGKLDKEDEFFLFTNQIDLPELHFDFPNFCYIKLPVNPKKKFLWPFFEQIIFPLYLVKYKLDVLFCPAIFNPLISFCKKVTVIHDCGYLYDRHFNFKNFYLRFITWAATKSSKVITISNFSKKEILNFFKVPNQKIKVIYPGVQKEFSVKEREGEEILRKLNVRKPYFFYIGLIVPYKNILNLLKAFKIVNKKYPDYKLILAGYLRPELLNLEDAIKKLNLQEKVEYVGPVKEKEKAVLYKNSVALIFPSLHEGFGLPVLEAQSLGVPVLTSNVTALPEVAGEGALYVDPYNVEEIAKGMERIAFDENLRRDLIKKGFENVKRFSWKKAAKELLKVFKEVYENSSSS
jgi:glycosyltransferase involved in cell wall biosynthesis